MKCLLHGGLLNHERSLPWARQPDQRSGAWVDFDGISERVTYATNRYFEEYAFRIFDLFEIKMSNRARRPIFAGDGDDLFAGDSIPGAARLPTFCLVVRLKLQ